MSDVDAVVVQPVLERVVAVGNRLDLRARQPLRAREQLVDAGKHRRGAMGREHLA